MRKLDLAIVVIRLLSIYWVTQAVALTHPIAFLFIHPRTSTPDESIVLEAMSHLAVPVLLIVLAVLLFIFSGRLAKRIVPGDPLETLSPEWQADDMQALAFASVGLLLVGFSAAPLIDGLRSIAYYRRRDFPSDPADVRLLRDAIILLSSGGFQLMMGSGCFFGAKGLARVWRKIRTAGVEVPPDNQG